MSTMPIANAEAERSGIGGWGRVGLACVVVFALVLPFLSSGYHLFQYAQVLNYAIALLGLNLLTGYNGQISLGHGAFFALGGYASAILVAKFGMPYWITPPIAGMVCLVAGFLFGLPALRLEGLYLALATFALAVAMPQLLNYKHFDALTGGSGGLQLDKPGAPFGLPITSDQWLYFYCLGFAAFLFLAARNLVRGRIGRAMVAIRDQPVAAETMGVPISYVKAMCFGISALYAGVGGALSVTIVGYVSPDSFGLFLSLSFLVGIVVGGLTSIPGMLFGAWFIEFVPNYADQLTSSLGENAKALPWAVYGVLLIAMMFVMPRGIAGAVAAAMARLQRFTKAAKRA